MNRIVDFLYFCGMFPAFMICLSNTESWGFSLLFSVFSWGVVIYEIIKNMGIVS